MEIEQRVQVKIEGAPRLYTYGYTYNPLEGKPLDVGDRVVIPPNQVQDFETSAVVVKLGSDYTGPVKHIVGRVAPGADTGDDLWQGFGEGDYA